MFRRPTQRSLVQTQGCWKGGCGYWTRSGLQGIDSEHHCLPPSELTEYRVKWAEFPVWRGELSAEDNNTVGLRHHFWVCPRCPIQLSSTAQGACQWHVPKTLMGHTEALYSLQWIQLKSVMQNVSEYAKRLLSTQLCVKLKKEDDKMQLRLKAVSPGKTTGSDR